MTLPDMHETPPGYEFLRIGGGYGAAAKGASPAGGLDVDDAGNLATDGDVTVDGQLDVGQDLAVAGNFALGGGGNIGTDTDADVVEIADGVATVNGSIGIETTSPAGRIDLGTATPGNDTPVTLLTGQCANSNWPASIGCIHDASYVDHFVILNGMLDGGAKASPTFTGAPTVGGVFIRNRRDAGAINHLQFGSFSGGSGQSPTYHMTVTKEGDVGIGTTTPDSTLHVAGDITAEGDLLFNTAGAIGTDTDTDLIELDDNDVTVNGSMSLGAASTDTLTCNGRLILRTVNDSGPMTATAGTYGEIVMNQADNKFYGCTTTGSPATWAALH